MKQNLSEGLWMGRPIAEMSRAEILEAWEHTDRLYREALLEKHV